MRVVRAEREVELLSPRRGVKVVKPNPDPECARCWKKIKDENHYVGNEGYICVACIEKERKEKNRVE